MPNTKYSRFKVAIVHYWLVEMRGGEKVVEVIGDIFPGADIFAHAYRPAKISDRLKSHRITTTFIARLPLGKRYFRAYLPLMPLALEELDLSRYDIVISSESGPAKGVIVRPDAIHICYCHTPMRYIWNMYHDYRRSASWLTRLLMPWLAFRLRMWDQLTAGRVDLFVANSYNVRRRIKRYYHRDAIVIHPPIEIDKFQLGSDRGSYYLCVGELIAYKRFDIAIEAFNRMGKTLYIVGDGKLSKTLSRMVGPSVKLLGRVSGDDLRSYYAGCRALIFPGEEDFGMVMVEAMASGRPVIAFEKGGAAEIVVPGQTGMLFREQSVDGLKAAVAEFEQLESSFSAPKIREVASAYSRQKFETAFESVVDRMLNGDNPLNRRTRWNS